MPLPATLQPQSQVVPAKHQEVAPKDQPQAKAGPVGVDELVGVAISRNPRIAKATFAIDAAQGKVIQAGLYPNPILAITGDEISDRTGPGGIWTAPHFTQEIVTARKLSLSQAVAATEADQATLALLGERYAIVGSVRAAYYDLYTLERRVAVLDELVKLASESVKNGKALLDNKQIARLDYIQLEVELERFRAKAEATRRELPAARKQLAAAIGDPQYQVDAATGPFQELPEYDPDRTLETVLASHPDVRLARVGVNRAQAAVRRAEVEPIPNFSLSTGYTYQGQNRSSDWLVGLTLPLPTWNRNQGNIRTARAELGMAIQEVGRVQNELTGRVATALRAYAAAVKEAELYKLQILPRANETYQLSLEAFKGGQFEYLRVIAAQRAEAEARLEYNRALGEAWKAAAELSGLLLEEWWPGPPPERLPAKP